MIVDHLEKSSFKDIIHEVFFKARYHITGDSWRQNGSVRNAFL